MKSYFDENLKPKIMKANELRIGNLLMHKLLIKGVVNLIYSSDSNSYMISFSGDTFARDIKTCKPIPLTEEILIKINDSRNENFCIDKELCAISIYTFRTHDYILFDIPLYVHELQNLYFALTGEELSVSEILK